MEWPILRVTVEYEDDVVAARRRAQQISGALGFDSLDQARIATAVSEIARNAFNYAGGGRIEFLFDAASTPQALLVTVTDRGPGVKNLDQILKGQYHSTTGMGLGILGARRLMDQVLFQSTGAGTIVRLRKSLPRRTGAVTPDRLRQIGGELAAERPQTPLDEVRRQNIELLRALDEVQQGQDTLRSLNRELEDTNRGVVALTGQLDEQNERLRLSDEAKSRFLSHMSHEFRTPLNSILALSRLLLDRADGDLSHEQERQVLFIRKGASELLEMVNELLDLAKIESGKTEIYPTEFTIENLYSGLRGVFRPLLANRNLNLIFVEDDQIPTIFTDEGKVSQILRNFISNALKFTEEGEIRVEAQYDRKLEVVIYRVIDTGIGISDADQIKVFNEFAQIEHHIQRKVKGTGLGLSLCRKMAKLLGGEVSVESTLGEGSTFSAKIPLRYREGAGVTQRSEKAASEIKNKILIIDDDESTRYLLQKMIEGLPFETETAGGGLDGLRIAQASPLRLILLDLQMPDLSGAETLARLKSDPLIRTVPVIIVTSLHLNASETEQLLLGACEIITKDSLTRETLKDAIGRVIDGDRMKERDSSLGGQYE